ncbi:PocR ligand-binding domain-containing protein [Pseudomonadota bacterium]
MAKNLIITDLISSRTLEKIQNYFAVATNISCVIRDGKGNKLTKEPKPSRLWKEIRKHSTVRDKCIQNYCDAMLKSEKTGDVIIYVHYADTLSFVVPITINNKIMAFFVGGLSRTSNPDIDVCTKEAEKLDITLDDYLEMYWDLTLVNEERLKACANLLRFTASTLSTLAHEGTQAQKAAHKFSSLNESLEREIAEKTMELQVAEFKYQNLFYNVIDGIYIADMDGFVIDMNPAGARILGFEKREDIIGKKLRNIYVDPSSRDRWIEKLKKSGKIVHFYPHIKLPNGKTKYVETNSTIMVDEFGNNIGVEGVFRDIDPRVHKNIKKELSQDVPKPATSKDLKND